MKTITVALLIAVAALFAQQKTTEPDITYPMPPDYETNTCARISYDLAFRADAGFVVIDATMRAIGCAQDEGGVYEPVE